MGAPKGSQNALGGRGNPNPSPETRLTGGKPGNKGGTGRVPHSIRDALRDILAKKGVAKVEEIIDGENGGGTYTPMEQLKALDFCGKYGLGEAKVTVAEEFCKAAVEEAAKYMTPEQLLEFSDGLIERIQALA
jgi:hypothetical protein